MRIIVSEDIKNICPVFVGSCITATVCNTSYSDALWMEIKETCRNIRESFTLDAVKEIPAIAATREIYKICGKDPSRYRPAAEALMRRVIQGKSLYQCDTLVDLTNMASMISGYSLGAFDSDKFHGYTLVLGIGRAGEPYEGIGRGMLNISGLPVYRDSEGGVGTPTSDSERTKVGLETSHLTVLVNGYDGNESHISETSELIIRLLKQYCNAGNADYYIYKCNKG